jgi:copper(I)-binding protein
MRSFSAAVVLCLSVVLPAQAAGPSIAVRDAWIRATPPGATTAAGYATITNHGPTTDRLMGASTTAASDVQLHQMSTAGGIMRMRAIPGGLAVAASATVRLAPNGSHLMLIGLKHPLKPGEHVRLTLKFQRAGAAPTDFTVREVEPTGSAGGMAGMHM